MQAGICCRPLRPQTMHYAFRGTTGNTKKRIQTDGYTAVQGVAAGLRNPEG